jgi:hypothetical protein
MEQYRHEREEIAKLLQSQGGQALLRRLRRSWGGGPMADPDPNVTLTNATRFDCLMELESMAHYETR